MRDCVAHTQRPTPPYPPPQKAEDIPIRKSRLCLVDLAGSERLKRSEAEGEVPRAVGEAGAQEPCVATCVFFFIPFHRSSCLFHPHPQTLKETQAINTSLSCLGNVVNALYEGKSFVGYRCGMAFGLGLNARFSHRIRHVFFLKEIET